MNLPSAGLAGRLPAPSKLLSRALLAAVLLVALFLRIYDLDRIPPGPFYDEAAATLLTGQVASGQALPIFIPNYTGHEALYYYLTIPLVRLLGMTVLALRLTSALIGAATALLAYLLARELFCDEPIIESHWLGLFTAALVATSFWHVSVSRYGYRAITLPMLQSLMLLALWRGLRLNNWKWIIAAGVLCGLVAYTYLSSRIVPVALAILLLTVLIADRAHWRLRLAQWAVMALVALVVFTPLGVFFATHPGTFFERTSQVSVFSQGDTWQTAAARNTLRVLQVFTVRGDPQVQFNLAELPLFQGVLALAFYAGLFVIIARLTRCSGFLGRARYVLLIVWPLVMLIPSSLSDPQQIPHSLRSIGMIPLVFVIPALGLVMTLGLLQRVRWAQNPRLITTLAAITFGAVLVGSGVETFQNYFRRWAVQPRLYYENNGDVADMARYLNSLPNDGRAVYVHMLNWYHPTVQVLTHNYGRIKWVQGDGAFVFPPGPAVYAWPRDSWPDESWAGRFFPPQARVIKTGPDGSPTYAVYALDHAPAISPTHPLSATFGGIIEAIGYDVLRDRPSGGKTDVAVYWRVLQRPDRDDYAEFATLNDAWGAEWGQGGATVYPSKEWTPGEIIAERVRVQTEDGTPPGGIYMLRLGWWSASTGQRLPMVDSQGQFAGTTAAIGPITVTRRIRPLDVNAVNIPHRLNVEFGGLALLGFDQWPASVRQGESEFITLYWQARTAPLPDYQVTLQMRAVESGQVHVLSHSGPAHGTYPTSQWETNEFIADRLALRIPPDTPPGAFTLEAQIDGWPAQLLSRLEVQAIARNWTPPVVSQPMSITFGSQIALMGYDVKHQTSTSQKNGGLAVKSQEMVLTLYWQALREMNENYTVFVHLVDRSGVVRAQQDGMPMNGTYATTLWMPGEFVTDVRTITLPPDLPPGDYALEVGLYQAETGERLAVAGNGNQVRLGKVSVTR